MCKDRQVDKARAKNLGESNTHKRQLLLLEGLG